MIGLCFVEMNRLSDETTMPKHIISSKNEQEYISRYMSSMIIHLKGHINQEAGMPE